MILKISRITSGILKLFQFYTLRGMSLSNTSTNIAEIEQDGQLCRLIQNAQKNEQCAIVNENDIVIGKDSKSACHTLNGNKITKLHRAFSVMLFNDSGEMLVHRRSQYKDLFPSHLTNTCCSHPRADDPYEMEEMGAVGVKRAAIRRLHFELGIPTTKITIDDLHLVGRYHYSSIYNDIYGENEIDYCFLIKKNLPLNINKAEIDEAFYISYDRLIKICENKNEKITPWFKLFIDNGIVKHWYNQMENYCSYGNNSIKLPDIIKL